MITSNYQVDGDIYSYADRFFCDSHDDKPSNADARDGLINGAILEETDTGKTYIFDKKANQWTEKAAGGGGDNSPDAVIIENRDESAHTSSYVLSSGSYNDLLTKLQAHLPIKVALEQTIDYGNDEFDLVATEAASASVSYYEGSIHEIHLFFVWQNSSGVAPLQYDLYILTDGTVTDRLD